MRIHINRVPIRDKAWGGGRHFYNAVHDYAPEFGCELVGATHVPDAYLIAGLDDDDCCVSAEKLLMYRALSSDVRIRTVIRVNENDARKNTRFVDERLLNLSSRVDGTVFVSNWLRDYFVHRGWKCRNNCVIHNGVDRNVFRRSQKIDNGKVNIVTAHWSDNALKGQDVVEWLDEFVGMNAERYTYTYIGRTKVRLRNSKLIAPLYGKALGEELGRYDVCINATRFDPGPNSVLEPIACEIPTYVHVDGGGAVEFAGSDHAFSNTKELEMIVLGEHELNSFVPSEWRNVVKEYVDFVRSI